MLISNAGHGATARADLGGSRGTQWYVKYRLPSGRQVQKRLGPGVAHGRDSLNPEGNTNYKRRSAARCHVQVLFAAIPSAPKPAAPLHGPSASVPASYPARYGVAARTTKTQAVIQET